MKGKTIFGALLVSVALCSQGFGFELLDRMLGLNCGGCGECKACAKVACCEKAGKCCCPEPACGCCAKPACCAKACGLLCEAGLLRKGLRLREVLQVPGDPGPRPVRQHQGHVRGQGLLLRAEVLLQGRQGLLPRNRRCCCCASPPAARRPACCASPPAARRPAAAAKRLVAARSAAK